MKKLLYLFILLFYFYTAVAQNKQSYTTLQTEAIVKQLKKITQDINEGKGNQNQQVQQLLYLKATCEKLGYDDGILQSGSLMMLLYGSQSRNKEIIELGSELKKLSQGKKDTYGYISNIYRRNALALGYLGLDDESIKDFRTAVKFTQTIENSDKKFYYLSLCYENMTVYYQNKQFEDKSGDSIEYYYKKSLNEAKKIRDNNETISNSLKYDQIAFSNMAIGVFYLSKADTKVNIQLAEKYLLEGLKIHENKKYNIIPDNKIRMLNQVSWLYSEKLDYQKSIDYALRALELEKQFHSPYDRVESFEFLADSYMGAGNKEKSRFYMYKYTNLKDSLHFITKSNAGATMKNMVDDEINEQKTASKKQLTIIGSLLLIAIIVTILLWRRKNNNLHKRYEEMISKINSRKENSPIKPLEIIRNNEAKGSIYIPDDTVKSLLEKLRKFEASEKYLRKDASLTWLANNLNTNTKYLSEIIKIERGKNFSNYINGLRINYIVDKLYNDPKYREYKISHLVEESGFVTHKVFVAAFKNEHGVTPSYFIEKLKTSDH